MARKHPITAGIINWPPEDHSFSKDVEGEENHFLEHE